jgi:type IV pilus assembly protein PilO
MTNFQTKKQLIIAGLAVLLLADVALVYFNAQLSAPPQSRQKVLATQSRQLALMKADIKRASDIGEKIPDVLKKFDQFEATLLPSSKGYSAILQELDEYAHDTHLSVGGNTYREKEVPGRNLTELTLDSSVSGDYSGIVRFLNHLQRSKNVYIVDSLAVDMDTSAPGPVGALRVTLHMRTYLRKA